MVQTVESRSGVHIDYWAITTFWGFKAMLDKIGGLTVERPVPDVRPVLLGRGPPAPAFSGSTERRRSRWLADRHSLLAGDFGRQENGGRLILRGAHAVPEGVRRGRRQPLRLDRRRDDPDRTRR